MQTRPRKVAAGSFTEVAKVRQTMKRMGAGFVAALVTMLVACSDPSGPRIPNPENPGGDDEEHGSVKVSLVQSVETSAPRTGP